MSEMVERVAKALRNTLDHHGVVMHPDDINGLAFDAIAAMREPTAEMLNEAYYSAMGEDAKGVWHDMIDAAIEDGK